MAGQVVLKAESEKFAKHEKACVENQYVSIPFIVDTIVSFAPKAVGFQDRVSKAVHNNFSTSKN
ncbi:hypothetical protein HanXRQr2_Chr14g0658681 [Helianthus annuus]|uniref:Uncharacterized protein n=1 Tax=Helianthus annuus TaxID=4232 RepID=A0A9K3H922_HELAN|nr:hypothetical protein HanXRQr2_Chr14g0658681 [Helianthus annuus]